MLAEPFADAPLSAVSGHGVPHFAGGDHPEARGRGGAFGPGMNEDDEVRAATARRRPLHPHEITAAQQPAFFAEGLRRALFVAAIVVAAPLDGGYFFQTPTDRRLRPLRRRLLMIARPPRVFMRARNPWVRRRLRLWG